LNLQKTNGSCRLPLVLFSVGSRCPRKWISEIPWKLEFSELVFTSAAQKLLTYFIIIIK
jgi:hypothetical protein